MWSHFALFILLPLFRLRYSLSPLLQLPLLPSKTDLLNSIQLLHQLNHNEEKRSCLLGLVLPSLAFSSRFAFELLTQVTNLKQNILQITPHYLLLLMLVQISQRYSASIKIPLQEKSSEAFKVHGGKWSPFSSN